MTSDRTSGGDPTATLRLLWRKHLPTDSSPRRGPKRALSVDLIVAAATALANDEGLAELTMRRLAARLGTGPMSVYTYVPGRAELLDLMLDDAYARMPRADTTGQPWQQRVRAVANDNRQLFKHHPWSAQVSTLRPPLGPGQIAKYDYELAAFAGAGLDDITTDAALTYLLTFIRATARDDADARALQRTTGDDQQWWDAAAPLLAQVLNPHTYPLASRIGATAGAANASAHNTDNAYAFGLERILDALEQLATPHGRQNRPAPSTQRPPLQATPDPRSPTTSLPKP